MVGETIEGPPAPSVAAPSTPSAAAVRRDFAAADAAPGVTSEPNRDGWKNPCHIVT